MQRKDCSSACVRLLLPANTHSASTVLLEHTAAPLYTACTSSHTSLNLFGHVSINGQRQPCKCLSFCLCQSTDRRVSKVYNRPCFTGGAANHNTRARVKMRPTYKVHVMVTLLPAKALIPAGTAPLTLPPITNTLLCSAHPTTYPRLLHATHNVCGPSRQTHRQAST